MDVREKLVELLGVITCSNTICNFCEHFQNKSACERHKKEVIADHLITNGVTVQEWISVDDMLPGEKVNCIVYYKHTYCDNDDYWAIGICFYDGEKFRIGCAYKVTHWMPLPQPPKGE